jgi:hypothetical protein
MFTKINQPAKLIIFASIAALIFAAIKKSLRK